MQKIEIQKLILQKRKFTEYKIAEKKNKFTEG